MADRPRECFLDVLRITACFFVIVNHTNSDIFINTAPGSLTWFASLTYFFVSKIAVPLFLMISGYLLLGKIDSPKKSFQRILRIIAALVGCGVIYSVYNTYYLDPEPSFSKAVKDFIAIYYDSPSNALWYLYAYLGILLMLPFLQKMAYLMTKRDYHIFFVISGLYFSVLPILNHYFPSVTISSELKLPLFEANLLMLFIGQYFSRFEIKKTKTGFFIASLSFVTMLAFNVIATYFEVFRTNYGYLFYDNRNYFPILIQSVCVFYMVSFLSLRGKAEKIVSYVGSCTFGIFLLSDMIIGLLKSELTMLSELMHPLFAVIIFELSVFAVGFAVAALLKKLPLIKKAL